MPIAWRIAAAAVLTLAFAPLAVLVLGSFRSGDSWSLAAYETAMQGGRVGTLLERSIMLAGASTLLALILGVPLAILAVKTNLPLRRTLLAVLSAPLTLPSYVLAQGWFRVLGKNGLVARIAEAAGLPGDAIGHATSNWLFSFEGCVLVLSTAVLPVIILFAAAAMSSVELALEDAGRLVASWPRVIWRITLPLARPAIVMAAVLSFLLAIGDYGVPSFLRIATFPVESFTQISAFYDASAATAAWVPMLFLVVACVAGISPLLSRGGRFQWRVGTAPVVTLERWRGSAFALVFAVALVLVLVPIGALAWDGLNWTSVRGAWDGSADSMAWSLFYAASTATLISIMGFLLARTPVRPGADRIGILTLLLFAMPGALLAFASAVTWNRPATAFLYASPLLLVTALFAQYLAVGYLGFRSALDQLSPSFELAAQLTGARWLRRTTVIVLPLVKGTMLAVWLLTFVLSLRDTSLPLQLSPPGKDPLTARTLTLAANGSEQTIAALCVFSVALALFPLGAGLWFASRVRRHGD